MGAAETYGTYLRDLVEGENGTKQPSRVRRHLRAMEKAWLIRWTQTPGCRSSGGGGWYLTDDGRAALAEVKQ